jgi:hypothetical protein
MSYRTPARQAGREGESRGRPHRHQRVADLFRACLER